MSDWRPIATAPMHEPILVAFHGGGKNMIQVVKRIKTTGHWGDFDYINSHYGEPKYWTDPLILLDLSRYPLTVPNDIAGPDCGCDGCTEEHFPVDESDENAA
jgi:hypothetical protein